MNDLLHHPLQEQEWFGILALVFVVGIFGLKALRSVLAHMHAGQEHDAATTLKMEMIQRGMSAVEIERILAAKISGPGEAGPIDRGSSHGLPARWSRTR